MLKAALADAKKLSEQQQKELEQLRQHTCAVASCDGHAKEIEMLKAALADAKGLADEQRVLAEKAEEATASLEAELVSYKRIFEGAQAMIGDLEAELSSFRRAKRVHWSMESREKQEPSIEPSIEPDIKRSIEPSIEPSIDPSMRVHWSMVSREKQNSKDTQSRAHQVLGPLPHPVRMLTRPGDEVGPSS